MNALVRAAGNKTALAAMGSADPFAAAAAEMGSSHASYVKFNGNTGEFSHGQEGEILPHGSRMAVNMHEMKRGFICWKNEQVVDEIMVKVVDGQAPLKEDLPDHGPYEKSEDRQDGWTEQASMGWRDPDTGEEYTFKVSSNSAIRAIGTFLKDYSRSYKLNPGLVPIVEIAAQSFVPKKKTYGKKWAPIMKIVEWKSEDELMTLVGDAEDDYAEPATTPAVAAPTAPQVEAAPESQYGEVEYDENGFPVYYENDDGSFSLSNGQPCDKDGVPLPEEEAGVNWEEVAAEEVAPPPAPAPKPRPAPKAAPAPAAAAPAPKAAAPAPKPAAPKAAAPAPKPAAAPAPAPTGGPRRRTF